VVLREEIVLATRTKLRGPIPEFLANIGESTNMPAIGGHPLSTAFWADTLEAAMNLQRTEAEEEAGEHEPHRLAGRLLDRCGHSFHVRPLLGRGWRDQQRQQAPQLSTATCVSEPRFFLCPL